MIFDNLNDDAHTIYDNLSCLSSAYRLKYFLRFFVSRAVYVLALELFFKKEQS